jgi:type II secretory pathway component PulF
MPFYIWSGINLTGEIQVGREFAHSVSDLNHILLTRDIGLIEAQVSKPWFTRRINTAQKTKFIKHLAVLLKSHIRLHQAFPIIIDTVTDRYFKSVLHEVSISLTDGIAFHEIIAVYPDIFDDLLSALVYIGQETGTLPEVLEKLAAHVEEIELFKSKVKQALIGPCLTAGGFICLLFFVFIFIIPRFQSFFAFHTQQLPRATQFIFDMSTWMLSISSIYCALCIILSLGCIKLLLKTNLVKLYKDRLLWRLGIFNKLLRLFYYTRFLRALGLLLQGGIQLPRALNLVKQIIPNRVVAQDIDYIEHDVNAGVSLAQACTRSFIFNERELVALVSIGEQSSNLSQLVTQAADIYQARVYEVLNRFTQIIQPLLLICLGLCIAGLIFALYMPLLTLSYIMA